MDKWDALEKLFGIKFRLSSGEFRPVNEWLDDIYLKLNREEVINLISTIMINGEDWFKDILIHQQ